MAQEILQTIVVGGQLVDLSTPRVMGILNVTPDSFYASSRKQTEAEIAQRAVQIMREGGSFIDIGAYSSRPGAADVSESEEMARLETALQIVRREVPEAIVSIDTFRAGIARRCVEDFGAHIINDISGGMLDAEMFATVAKLDVPYILTHSRGTPQTMQQQTDYDDIARDVLVWLGSRVEQLRLMGVCDVMIDPGFGFAKTLEQNYELLSQMNVLSELGCPLLVGVSRKSMVWRVLGCEPAEALAGTTALHVLALQHGANILRVHDVKAAADAIRIVEKYKESLTPCLPISPISPSSPSSPSSPISPNY